MRMRWITYYIKKPNILSGRRIVISLLAIALIGMLLIPASYAATQADVTLAVKQVVSSGGLSAPQNKPILYKLTPYMASYPMPTGSSAGVYTFTITGTTTKQIGPITYTTAGFYTYELTCVTEADANYSFDRRVYRIQVFIAPDMTATIYVFNEQNCKVETIEFKHDYDSNQWPTPTDPCEMADPPVVKTVSGTPSTSRTFTFRLVAQNVSNPMPAGSENGVKTIQITGSGQAVFGTWIYTAEGVYRYSISEVNSGVSGYTYDTAVYTIIDTVTAVNGHLTLSRLVVNSSNKQVTSLSFINTYRGSGGTTTTPPPSTTPSPSSPTTPPPTTPNPTVPSPGLPPVDPGHLIPGDGGTYIEIDDDGTPTGEWTYDDDDGIWIYDEFPPLINTPPISPTPPTSPTSPTNPYTPGTIPGTSGPKTGDDSQMIWDIITFCAAGLAALICAVYLLTGKRRGKATR